MLRRHWLGLLAGLLLAGGAGAAVGAFVLLSGTYETAATHQHFALTHRLLETGLRISVVQSASHLVDPRGPDPQQLRAGAACFREHCMACHGAPGVAPAPAALGMLPVPTSLVLASRDWRPRELFWIVSKGVRMTGMPAWEYRLSTGSRWATVTFLEALPGLDAAAWQRLSAGAPPEGCSAARGPADLAAEQDRREDPAVVAFRQYGCVGCHRIDGITGPATDVGPRLSGWATRRYVAGVLPNTRANLAWFIRDPAAASPGTLMPDMGVPAEHAARMARYLLPGPPGQGPSASLPRVAAGLALQRVAAPAPDPGQAAIERAGCGACHEIPGVRDAVGRTGPPLGGLGRRPYIAGRLPTSRPALARFLLDPPAVKPGTAMPALGLDPDTADAMAAWLLREP